MSATLAILRVGPSVTVQDLGRPGTMANGLSRGGAADRTALVEGAALLGQGPDCAALELAGFGGEFTASADIRIALTGAPMQVRLDDQPLAWNASHRIEAGQRLSIGAALRGIYGYLHVGGGIDTPVFLGSRATHLVSGIGSALKAGAKLPVGPDRPGALTGLTLRVDERFAGGTVRILPSVQTDRFAEETLRRFTATPFSRTARGNRQGVELAFDGDPFACADQLSILSEPMVAGDIQMTGEGVPFVLLPECQTTGGYPRVATVLPDDLPLVAQAGPGTVLHFAFIDHETAVAAHRPPAVLLDDLRRRVEPLVRDPHMMHDLLSYQLISGVVNALD
ncbi:MAG: biotin-dependent carboxyltransferase family protein [Pseudomonadota bacterium]